MIEFFKYSAKCNRQINSAMSDVILSSDKNPYDAQINGYYKSIGEILDHYYIADIIWLNTFRQVKESSIFQNPLFTNIPQWNDRLSGSIETFRQKRESLDQLIIDFINELSPEDLNKIISRKTRAGQVLERLLWKALMHMLNHDTHHRGQISQILDELGIANDYSNMIRVE